MRRELIGAVLFVLSPIAPGVSLAAQPSGTVSDRGTIPNVVAQSMPDAPELRGLGAPAVPSPTASGVGMSLADLEAIAVLRNPTLQQARSSELGARARARQAAMLPNPIVGFEGPEWAFRGFRNKAEYFGYFDQNIPLGGKLARSRDIYLRQAEVAAQQAAAQRIRVLNSVRAQFYETLGAQMLVDLRTQLATLSYEAVATTSQLFNVGQADRPDYLEAQVEAEQVAHQLVEAKNELQQSWESLAALVGSPAMPITRLKGRLEERVPQFDKQVVLNQILTQSPEIRAAQAEMARTRAVLARARVEPIPDLYLRGALGYSSEFLDSGNASSSESGRPQKPRRTGFEAAIQVGMDLPIWNRNQGGIAAARAEMEYAQSELERIQLGIQVRLAQAIRNYNNRVDAINRYETVILPKAAEAYRLYLAKFQQMSASYPQVLIAQRTLIQVQEQYIESLSGIRQTSTQLEGFLLTGGLDAPPGKGESLSVIQVGTSRSGTEQPTSGTGFAKE